MTNIIKLNSNITLECTVEEILIQCIKDNTFDNPIYRNNELNHRSNWTIESKIKTYRYEGKSLVLPRGYMRNLLNIFHEQNITPQIIDERVSQPCSFPRSLKGITLRPYQERAVEAAMKFDQGTIVSPTGSGKSLLALEIVRRRQQKTLILVHRKELAEQWAKVIKERMDFLVAGMIGNGSWEIGDITVAMIQTLSSKQEKTKEMADTFGLIIADECQHLPSNTFFNVMDLLNAKYRYGLSATVRRADGLEEMIYRCVGEAISTISRDEVESLGSTVPTVVKALETGFSPAVNSWHDYLEEISVNTERNLLITDLAASQTSPVLILCDRIAHTENLSEMLSRNNLKHVLAHGQIQDRDEIMEKIKKAQITIATASLIGEGIDIDSWSILIMASPISSEIKLLQCIGRIVRPKDGKEVAVVFDLKDNCGFSGASFKKRFEIYKKHKIWVEFSNKKVA